MHLHSASLLPPPPSTCPFPLYRPRTTGPFIFTSKPGRLTHTRAAGDTSFYETLGIPVTGTLPEIKKAYKQLARKYHPDVSPPGRLEEHTRRFVLVQQAYETLSDPTARALYDRDLNPLTPFPQGSSQEKSQWRSKWQDQLRELKRRSNQRDEDAAGGENSFSPMRRHRTQISPIS